MTTDALFTTARTQALDDAAASDDYWAAVEALWAAEPREVWALVEPLATSSDARLQQLCVDVLSRLGDEAQPLFFETLALFDRILAGQPTAEVLTAVGQAAARFHDPSVVTMLAPHAGHPDAVVREAVLHAIRRSSKPEALRALISLSRDPVPELREWATFALGSQLPLVDAPEIRATLAERLVDSQEAVRDEATVGLGLRGDARALGPLKAMLERGDVGVALFEAAAALASPLLLPALRALVERGTDSLDEEERAALHHAVSACAPAGQA